MIDDIENPFTVKSLSLRSDRIKTCPIKFFFRSSQIKKRGKYATFIMPMSNNFRKKASR